MQTKGFWNNNAAEESDMHVVWCMISSFCCEVSVTCTLLGYYTASSGNFSDVSGRPMVSHLQESKEIWILYLDS
jgi:hypothetical protein